MTCLRRSAHKSATHDANTSAVSALTAKARDLAHAQHVRALRPPRSRCYAPRVMSRRSSSVLAWAALALCACPAPPPEPEDAWEIVHSDLAGALLSVWGTGARDVWAVGGDTRDGAGPLVIHFDGESWTRLESGEAQGNLWWVFGFEGGPVYMGGEGGMILRNQDGDFSRMTTPGVDTVFGIWGATPDDVWAVGGASESTGGFAWRLSGDTWVPEPSLPASVPTGAAIWKIYGTARDDAWLVGSNGVALRWDGASLTSAATGVGSSLFTVHAADGRYVAVGGLASGIIVEHDGSQWRDITPAPPPSGLSGVTLGEGGLGLAVGSFGAVLTLQEGVWALEDLGFALGQNLHGSWIDDEGGLWAVGGQTFAPPYTEGILLHRGTPIPNGGL